MSDKPAGVLIRDRLRHNKIKVLWIIAGNGNYSQTDSYSSEFSDDQKNTWQFQLRESYAYRRLNLVLKKCVSSASGYCTFSILDADHKEVVTQKKYFSYFSANNCTGYDMFVDLKDVAKLRLEDRWRIICRIAIVEGYDPSGNLSNTGELSRELNNLFSRELFSDVVLCVSGREFKAHRSILAARSRVFESMFSNDLVESRSGRVELTDMSAEVLEEMLKFIYTGKSVLVCQMYYGEGDEGIDQDLAIGLLQVADKYQLDELKAICEDALADSLTAESAHKIMALSCLHNSGGLANQCVDFINSNKIEFTKQLVAGGSFIKKIMA